MSRHQRGYRLGLWKKKTGRWRPRLGLLVCVTDVPEVYPNRGALIGSFGLLAGWVSHSGIGWYTAWFQQPVGGYYNLVARLRPATPDEEAAWRLG